MRSPLPNTDQERQLLARSVALGGGLGLLGGIFSGGGGNGVALLAAPFIGALIGFASGLARVHESRRGEDLRPPWQKFKDGLTLVIIWAGWMFLICYAVATFINSGLLF